MNPIEIFVISFALGLSVGLCIGGAMYLFLRERLAADWLAANRASYLEGRAAERARK